MGALKVDPGESFEMPKSLFSRIEYGEKDLQLFYFFLLLQRGSTYE